MLTVLGFLLFLVALALALHKFSTTKLGTWAFDWLSWYVHYILIATGLVFLLLPAFGHHYSAY